MGSNLQTDSLSIRERIIEAAIEVIAERGYSSAGIQEIIDRAGTSKGSFYFHFPSKEQMVSQLVNQMSGKLIRKVEHSIRFQPTPLHRVTYGIDTLISTFSKQQKIARILLLNIMGHGITTDKLFLPTWNRFSELIEKELNEAVSQKQIEPIDTTLFSKIWLGALHEIIVQWILTNEPKPLTKTIPGLTTALLKSVGVDPVEFHKQASKNSPLDLFP